MSARLSEENVHLPILNDLPDIVAEVCSLRANAKSGKPNELIVNAISIDARLNLWFMSLPKEMQPTRLAVSNQLTLVHSNYIQVYRDLATATLVNNARAIRLLLHQVLACNLSSPSLPGQSPPGQSPQSYLYPDLSTSLNIQKRLISEICASLWFHLDPDPDWQCNLTSKLAAKSDAHFRAAGGNAILWPLFVAGDRDVCSQDTRRWIVNKLKYISMKLGIQQASKLANILLENQEVTDMI